MKFKVALIAAAAAVFAATPAAANEARAEVRGGYLFADNFDEVTAGAAVGYDWDLGDKAFAGLEASGDKILEDGTRLMFGATGRVGFKPSQFTRLYVNGGYTTKPCGACEESWHAGAGVQQKVASKVYLKAEYRHAFVGSGLSDFDVVALGVGVTL